MAFKLSYYLYNYLYKLNKNLPIVFTGGSLLFICKGVINIIDINKMKNIFVGSDINTNNIWMKTQIVTELYS